MNDIEFIAGGYNKSGTTFLQRFLNYHPDIQCKPEQHLRKLTIGLNQVITEYEKTVELFDKRTAQQGIKIQKNKMLRKILSVAINSIFESDGKTGSQAVGINDNWAIEIWPILQKLKPDLYYIYIIRDPRDVCVSLYYHLTRTEPHRVTGVSLDSFANRFGSGWNQYMEKVFKQKAALPEKVKIIHYERLLKDPTSESTKSILKILGVANDSQTIQRIAEATRKDFETGIRNKNGFYRTGGRETWRATLETDTAKEIERRCKDSMQLAGYS
jgi:hypothetical protein